MERLGEMRKGRRERIEKGSREKIERKEKETNGSCDDNLKRKRRNLPLLVFQLPQGTAVLLRRHEFQTRFCSKALQQ